MFGGSTNTFGNSSFGGFGQTTTNSATSGGLFGNKSAFGSTAGNTFGSNTTSTFGGATSGGLFGSKPSTTAGTGLFGSTNTGTTGSAFGGSTGFGSSTSTSTFGGGSSLFGSTGTSTAATGGLFGGSTSGTTFGSTANAFGSAPAANTGSSLFGNSGSSFGSTQQNGTNIKFNPLTTNDNQIVQGKQQSVQVRLQAIVCMKEYENKSMEELRCEDYIAGRKSGNTGAATAAATPAVATGGLFGNKAATTGSTFGAFGATTPAAPATGGLFGSTSATNTGGGLFGSSNAAKPGGLFGSTTGTASTGGSLFGNSGASTGFGASTGTSAFGATNNTSAFGSTSTGGGLFGSTPAKPTGGLFGSTTTSTSGGLFGGTSTFGANNTASTGTSLFGNTTATPAASGGLFGASGATGTTGGLFGNTAKPAFGGFGTNTSTANAFGSTTGTSLFGNTAQNKTGGGLFGNTAATTGGSLFGNTTANTGGSLFGGTTSTGGSLFGNTTAAKPGDLFGGSTFGSTNTGGSLFGGANTTGALGGNNQQPILGASLDSSHIHQVVAALSSTPFGDSPLFRTALDEHKKLKPATPPPASLGNNRSRISSKLSTVRPKPLNGGYNQLFEGLEDDISPSPEAFLPRNSLKKLVLQSNRYSEPETPEMVDSQPPVSGKTEQIDSNQQDLVDTTMNTIVSSGGQQAEHIQDTRPEINATPIKLSPIRKLPFNNTALNDTHSDLMATSQAATPPPARNTPLRTQLKAEKSSPDRISEMRESKVLDTSVQDDDLGEPDEPVYGLDGKPLKPAPPTLPFTLDRPEYYTIPGPEELLDLVKGESLVVTDLVVGRTGYGEVKFLGAVDIWGMDLDSTIFFRRKEISVYPDDNNKPPQGEALNRKSEVTLDCVYPTDKATRDNVTDPKEIIRKGFPAYLEKKTFKMGAKFIEYKPETGQWTFMVKHFSQYGLLDDSEEEEEEEAKEDVKRVKEELLSNENSFDDEQFEEEEAMSDEDNNGLDTPADVSFVPKQLPAEYSGYKAGLFGLNESEEDEMAEEEEEEEEMFVQGSQFNYNSSLPLGNKRAALNKTALKMEKLEMVDNMNLTPKALKSELLREKKMPKVKEQAEAVPKFGVSVVPSVLCLPPLSKSVANGRTHLKMDEGLIRHFAYRANWTDSSRIILKTDQIGGKSSNMKLFESTRGGSLNGLEVTEIGCHTKPAYHTNLLETQLQHTSYEEGEGSAIATPSRGSECLESLLCTLTDNQDSTVLTSALKLIKTLWADAPDKEGAYASEQFRKDRLTAWLGEQLEVLAQKHTIEYSKLGVCHLPAVIAWLCAGGVQEACQLLCKAGDFQLALLVSQSSTPIIRQLVLKQLDEWRESGYDSLISVDRLRVYVLLSGEQLWESSTRTINVCEGLDWLSSFSLILGFLPPSAPLDLAVAAFKEAFQLGVSVSPVLDDAGNLSVFWQLLLLYCNPAHPLAEVLNNQGITSNMLDERNVWFILNTLTALGLPRPSPRLLSKITTAYAAQLDRLGLWNWSVFVSQHLPAGRLATMRGIIARNTPRNETNVSCVGEQEQRCLADHRLEGGVFQCARALHAQHKRDWEGVVTWYTTASKYNSAHRVLMDRIAPGKIVSRCERDLGPLLEPLHEHRGDIQGWDNEGAIYLRYLNLPRSLPQGEEELELLRYQISALGHQLNCLPYNQTPEICAVHMMGLRTCTLLIEVWRALFGNSENRELLLTMKTFPLPSDYALNDIITKLSSEIVSEDNFNIA